MGVDLPYFENILSDIQNGWWNKDESDTDIPPGEPDYDCDSEGHVYGEVNYVWNGYTSCVAQRTCSKCDYTQKEYAEIASSVLKTATCLEDGRVNSVATFTNAIFETQEKTLDIGIVKKIVKEML